MSLSSEAAPLPGVRGKASIRQRLRLVLFAATGAAVPFYAFSVVRAWGRPVDLATILAALFILLSLPDAFRRRSLRPAAFLLAAAAIVPLLALLPPRPSFLDASAFFRSYVHWLLVVAFFVCATTLRLSRSERRALLAVNVWMAALVAIFGLYQVIGFPRQWPLTGSRLLPIQREGFRQMPLADFVRPTSVFLEPSWFGGYLVWTTVLGGTLAFSLRQQRALRLLWGAVLLVLVIALTATLSLGAFVDALVALSTFLLVLVRVRGIRARQVLWVGATVCFIGLLFLWSPPGRSILRAAGDRYQRVLETRRALREEHGQKVKLLDSTWIRIRDVQRTVGVFLSRPLRGIGLGQFSLPVFGEKLDFPASEPACGWIAAAAEMGVLGAAFLTAVLLWLLREWRALPQERRDVAVPALLALAWVQQLHTASFIDLWWWFPLSLAVVLTASRADSEPPLGGQSAVSSS